MTDLTEWTDEDLADQRRAISDEQARRETLARIPPDEIATLRERYLAVEATPPPTCSDPQLHTAVTLLTERFTRSSDGLTR